jgi:hypothetical protein
VLTLLTALLGVAHITRSTAAHAQTVVDQSNAIILTNTVWTKSGSPYTLTRDVEVRPSATLTLEAGVEVRFAATDGLAAGESAAGVEFVVKGALNANGTAAEPILLNGQNLPGPLANATGLRFASTATGSSLSHVRIEGLAYGVDVRAGSAFTLIANHLHIEAGRTAFRRTVAMGDQVFTDSTLIAPEVALDLVAAVEDARFSYTRGAIEGGVVVRGSQGFGSTFDVLDAQVTGDITLIGDLQAGARVSLERVQLSQGGVAVEGALLTGATLSVLDSRLWATAFGHALRVSGAVLADARVDLTGTEVRGDVRVGPAVALSGSGEGQYVLVNTPSTWAEASAGCAAMGARLADARNATESEALYELAKRSATGLAWTAGSLISPPCGVGSAFVNIGGAAQCSAWQADGFPVQTVTVGKDCACGNVCPQRTELRANSCLTASGFACTLSVEYQSRIPDCDAGAQTGSHCYGDDVSWSWASGAAFSQSAALWGEAVADRLACFSGDHQLSTPLHIAIDAQDPSGSANGRTGLWRARSEGERYGYLCEGKLALVGSSDSSRGALTVEDVTLNGRFESRVGTLTLSASAFEGAQSHTLSRGATVSQNTFTGAFGLTSRATVTVSRNSFTGSALHGGGLSVEADVATLYANTVDGGVNGVTLRGPAIVENNVITRAELVGLSLFPEGGPSPSDDTVVRSNTLVQNPKGITVSGTVNAPATQLANNLVYRGGVSGSVGVSNLGASRVTASYNNVADYTTLYQSVLAGAGALSVNPVLVADFPANPPILRLDSGSPLIDVGSCALATALDFDGAPRPFDGDFDSTPGCDIGAYEFGPARVFIYADGVPATSTTFSTGREVTLSLWGERDSFVFEVKPVTWHISEAVGVFDEATGRFRPTPEPGLYAEGISASFGALTASLDLDLDCGCIAPDLASGLPGGCNGVPACYFTDWSNACPVRENYCQLADIGSLENPVVIAADETRQLRAGGRDIFGTVFKVAGPFTYSVVAGGASVDSVGRLTAGTTAGAFPATLQISKGAVSGRSDLVVTPAAPHSIVVTKPQQSIGTTRTLQYSARVLDRFGNEVPNAPISWSLVGGADSQINATGRVTAGCTPGTFSNAVVATSGGVSGVSTLVVELGGANLVGMNIQPASLEVAATQGGSFTASVTDACGYTRLAAAPTFSARANAGSVNAVTGSFVAGCNLGAFASAVTVSAEGFTANAAVTVTDAPLARVRLQPEVAQVRVNSTATFEAIGEDSCGRVRVVDPLWSTSIVNATTSSVGDNSFRRLNVGCAVLDTYAAGVRATVGPFQAVASVVVTPGDATVLNLNQTSLSLPAGNALQLIANSEDACGNSRNDLLRWSASNGQVTGAGLYTAGCVRGDFSDAVVVRAGTLERSASVRVTDGVLSSIEIEPSAVSLQAGASRQLRANLYDGCRNLIAGQAAWSVAQGASVTQAGVITAGEVAGSFSAAVVAELNGFQDQADLTVTPAAAVTLQITPAPLRVAAGGSVPLQVTAFDTFGNSFIADPLWTVNPVAGAVSASDVLTAGPSVGVYPGAVTARVGSATLSVDLEIVPAQVASIALEAQAPANGIDVVDLSNLVAGQAQSVVITAQPLDAFGNAVTVAPNTIQWSVSAGGGTALPSASLTQATYVVGTRAASHNISATIGAVSGRLPVVIRPAAPVSVSVFDPAPPNNAVNFITLSPNQTFQLGVRVSDIYGNQVDTPVTFGLESDRVGLVSVSPSGLVRAGTVSGVGTLIVRVNATLSVSIPVSVIPGAPVTIDVSPERVVTQPLAVTTLVATFRDAFGNAVAVEHVWADFNQGGDITANGVFTAGGVAGTFNGALVVRGRGLERLVDVVINPGAARSMRVEPSLIIASPNPNTPIPLSVVFSDAQGNVTTAPGARVTWGLRQGSGFDLGADGVLVVDCSRAPGLYAQEVQVSADIQGTALSTSASIEVRAGATHSIEVNSTRLEVEVNNSLFLSATPRDICEYPALSVPRWSVVSGEGSITPQGHFTASTVAGDVQLIASVDSISSSAVSVVVRPSAPTIVFVVPQGDAQESAPAPGTYDVTLTVGATQGFVAYARDTYGNEWRPEVVTWAVKNEQGVFVLGGEPVQEGPVGTITDQGELQAGLVAGRYVSAVKASVGARSGVANVYLVPDAVDEVRVMPSDVTLIPRQVLTFTAKAYDQHQNELTGVTPAFVCNGEVGLCSETGVLTATDRVGEYLQSVSAVLNGVRGFANVRVENSAPSRVEISPRSTSAAVGSSVILSARVFDTTGVEIIGAGVSWSVEPTLGTINTLSAQEARLDVASAPGRYLSGLTATVELAEGGRVEGSADVVVPVDFDVDGVDDVDELASGLDPENPDDVLLDWDEDQLTNAQEVEAGTDLRDADSDDDGVIDGDEVSWDIDTDRDGLINALDSDSDDDGVYDGTESGLTEPSADTDRGDRFVSDADPETQTSPVRADSDGDGLDDGVEDTNRNGRLDPGETPPTRDFNYIYCDPAALESGCPEGLICINTICTEPAQEESKAPDTGCASSRGEGAAAALLGLLGALLGLRRRRLG